MRHLGRRLQERDGMGQHIMRQRQIPIIQMQAREEIGQKRHFRAALPCLGVAEDGVAVFEGAFAVAGARAGQSQVATELATLLHMA
jgi:hypothetical protein